MKNLLSKTALTGLILIAGIQPTSVEARQNLYKRSISAVQSFYAMCKAKLTRSTLHVNDLAPDFALSDETGTMIKLSDLQGQNIALYFYPKDQTPNCTAQACSIRNGFSDLKKAGIIVLGISYDSPESHRAFKEKHHLNFPLLSDSDKAVSKLYHVSGFFFPDRATFLIDKTGRIVKILTNVNVKDHAQEIIDAFEA